MPYSEEPIVRGWLNKLKSSKFTIGGRWNRRWVTVQNIGMGELALCYWNGPPTPTESSSPNGWIFLKEIDELYTGKDPLPTTFCLGNRKTTEAQRQEVESEINKSKETVFVITAFSRNFVFNAPDLESYRHWMAVLVRLCGYPFNDHPWQKHWGKEVVIPDNLRELWCKIRKNCPYRNSQYSVVSLSARIPPTMKESSNINNTSNRDINTSSQSASSESLARKNIVLHASYQRLQPNVHDDSPSVSINEDSPNYTSIKSNCNNINSNYDNVETFDIEDGDNSNDNASEPPKYNYPRHKIPTMEELKEVDPDDEELSRSNDTVEPFRC